MNPQDSQRFHHRPRQQEVFLTIMLTLISLLLLGLLSSTSAFTPNLPNAVFNKMVIPAMLPLKHDSTSSTTSLSSNDDYYFIDSDASETTAFTIPKEKSLRSTLQIDTNGKDTSSIAVLPFPWIVGHRGCLYQQLENTREGFQECARMGCDAVELDVFLLKCGTLVVFHGDGTDEFPGLLQNYCSVEGSILDYTYQEAVEKLTFNPNYEEFGCPPEVTLRGRIPTLEVVLKDAKQSGMDVKIELKGEGTVKPTLELVERLDMMRQCSYSSFDLDRLKELRDMRHDRIRYPSGALFADVPSDFLLRAEKCGATEIHLQYDTCTKERIQEIHQAGFGSMLWMRGPIGMASDCTNRYWDVGNEDESMYLALMETGVQQMCVNKPDILVELRQQLQGQKEALDLQIKDEFFETLNQRNGIILPVKSS